MYDELEVSGSKYRGRGHTMSLNAVAPMVLMRWMVSCSMNTTTSKDGIVLFWWCYKWFFDLELLMFVQIMVS